MYRAIVVTIVLFIAVLGLLANATAVERGRILVVQATGKGTGTTRPIPPVSVSGTKEGNCFDVELFDVMAERTIGTATRCFADVNTAGTGMALTETTFFRLREGTLVSRSRTIIQPAIDSTPQATHIAVALPDTTTNTILTDAGNGTFKSVTGNVRLIGAMDMSQFRERNEIAFNDMFVIELEEVNRDGRIRQVQKQLQRAGFYSGAIDGIPGPETETALRQYQAKHGLPTTGRPDEATRKSLSIQ
jgi:hypothetical protein